jgi:hypothetical protein
VYLPVIVASGTGAPAVDDQTMTGIPTGTTPLKAFREEKPGSFPGRKPGSFPEIRLLRVLGERGKKDLAD